MGNLRKRWHNKKDLPDSAFDEKGDKSAGLAIHWIIIVAVIILSLVLIIFFARKFISF